MNVEREVARSVFPRISGILFDLERYEKGKKHSDKSVLDFYVAVSKALWAKHAQFRHYTNEQVEVVIFGKYSPILKQLALASSKAEQEEVIAKHKDFLLGILDKNSPESLNEPVETRWSL